ncbi:MAG: hypothetical protein QOJ99_2348 [Bryobacterales bacterium]|jgi:hypothetical protein|nr:hypothetical protein [Bryobacterales bacterium]
MTIDITPGAERVVREELRNGHFQSFNDLIMSSVQAWRERNMQPERPLEGAGPVTNRKRRAREFVEWANSHPDTPPPSDEAISRASLNPDR